MAVHITAFQLENVKRVKAFALEPAATGLTVIGGKNKQGKTSVLDGIGWLAGGAKFAPTNVTRDGAMNPANGKVTFSNGITAERRGKNGALHVTDPSGRKAGQQLLDEFIEPLALNLTPFLNAKNKADYLLAVLGIDQQLAELDQEEKRWYDERTLIGREKEKKEKHAQELPEYPDAPAEPVSISELLQQQQAILAKNGENQRLRDQRDILEAKLLRKQQEVVELREKLAAAEAEAAKFTTDLATAVRSSKDLQDESTAELEASIANMETINAHVAANLAKERAQEEAADYGRQYNDLTQLVENVRQRRAALLESAQLPLPGLTVENGVLLYNKQPWDCMSNSEQLRVATAIVRRLKPDCGLVLLNELEKFDVDSLREFNEWAEAEKLQVIATRVSTGEECTIIIEDGLPAGKTFVEVTTPIPASEEKTEFNWGE